LLFFGFAYFFVASPNCFFPEQKRLLSLNKSNTPLRFQIAAPSHENWKPPFYQNHAGMAGWGLLHSHFPGRFSSTKSAIPSPRPCFFPVLIHLVSFLSPPVSPIFCFFFLDHGSAWVAWQTFPGPHLPIFFFLSVAAGGNPPFL